MIRTQATVIRTTIMHFGIEFQGHFRLLVVIPDLLVILHIVSNHYLTVAMGPAVFQHKHFCVLKHNLGITKL
ncbi:hypothetical protein D3C87_1319030 [compost metagenome]